MQKGNEFIKKINNFFNKFIISREKVWKPLIYQAKWEGERNPIERFPFRFHLG